MTENQYPKLRAIDVRPVVLDGRPVILLRDPLQLTDKTVIISQELAPVLALCDGTRDLNALLASLTIRYGLRVGPGVLSQLMCTLDEALLLENERFARARQQILVEYRQAPSRPPISAGQSYPTDAEELKRLLRGYLEAVESASPGSSTVRGLISPHIDYERGGPVYAAVWKQAGDSVRRADLVVLLGTDHYGDGLVTLTRQHYSTPFGVLPTAQDVVDTLAEAIGEDEAFAGELYHRCEHSIELAAVWLHYLREGQPCELVPILCGSFNQFVQGEANPQHHPIINKLVEALRQATAQRQVLVVAAADLSHVGPAFGGAPQDLWERARLQAADDELLAQVCAGDAEGFFAAIKRDGNQRNVCGLPPIYLALRLLSPVQGELIAYDRCPADQQGTSFVSVCGVVFH
ncbi:MAG: AmmeMemoRadiSam system protein B [Anaerolineae bacterium]|nr:AmmeMemoRadiSam system protein B [Anaerolineae bacterium]